MRVKAKTWGVIGQVQNKQTNTKSQLQTVLITASGPQALNALVHRKRYTQGSRQNRCVSSQNALALRARVRGKGSVPCGFIMRPTSRAVAISVVLTLAFDCCGVVATASQVWTSAAFAPGTALAFGSAQKLPTQNCLRRGIQLYN